MAAPVLTYSKPPEPSPVVRRIIRSLAIIVGGSIAALSALALFGEQHWLLDLLANFRVQLAVLSFIVLIFVALTGSVTAAALAAIGLLINAWVIIPLYLTPVEASRPVLTVASFNLLATNDQFDDVIDWVRSTDADVVFLHEGTAEWEAALRQSGLPYQVVATREPEFAFGTIVLAPRGANVVNHGFSRLGQRAVEVVVNRITVIGIHPLAPISEEGTATRDQQLAWVAERARSRPGEAVIIGDFNSTPWTSAFRANFTDAGMIDTQVGNGIEATWRVGSLWQLPIDNAVLTDQLGVFSRQLGPDLGSDHLPVVLEVGPRDFTG